MPSPVEVNRALNQVLTSRTFARAGQLRRLLSYIVRESLDGGNAGLKETVIGVGFFELPADFNPKSDPIVRMEMRRLRNRLRQYYGAEGSSDELAITLEPGSYVPQFRAHEHATRNGNQNGDTARMATAESQNSTYRLLVRGRYFLSQTTPESLRKSNMCFSSVLEREPESPAAWAGKSIAESLAVMYHLHSAAEGWQEARNAARNAIAFGPLFSGGYTALGILTAIADFHPIEAGQHFEQALRLNSRDNAARIAYAVACLAPVGKLAEAEQEVEFVLANDPLNAKALQILAVILYFQRRYSDAVEVALSARDVLSENPVASFVLANSYDRMARYDDAIREFRKCEELMPFLRVLQWSSVLNAIYKGRVRWIKPAILGALGLLSSSHRLPFAMAGDLMIRLGEYNHAVSFLRRAFETRAFRMLYFEVDPAYELVRCDSRCADLRKHLQAQLEPA